MSTTQDSLAAGHAAFLFPGFRLYQIARFCIVFSTEMQSVAVGWQVYEITRRPLYLGLVGLAQFLPGVLLFLLAGHVADRFNRRKLLSLCYAGYAVCSALLLYVTLHGSRSVIPIFAILLLLGTVRCFSGPTSRAIIPQLVPEDTFQNAVAWNSTIFRGATILGPAIGGLAYVFFRGPAGVYGLAFVVAGLAVYMTLQIHTQSKPRLREPLDLKTVFAGLHYIWGKKVILGSISLDLFAVLLGGAVALLPVYAREILHPVPGDWVCYAARPVLAPARWLFFWPTSRFASALGPPCSGASRDLVYSPSSSDFHIACCSRWLRFSWSALRTWSAW